MVGTEVRMQHNQNSIEELDCHVPVGQVGIGNKSMNLNQSL